MRLPSKKVNVGIRELVQTLEKSDRSAFATKTAVQEMEIIAKYLDTYHDAWEGEGI